MKRYILIISAAIAFCGYAKADQAVVDGVKVSNLAIEKEYNTLNVDMVLDLKELDVPKNRAVVITPRLVNGRDSLDLTSVTIYGRKRYIYYQRNSYRRRRRDGISEQRCARNGDVFGERRLSAVDERVETRSRAPRLWLLQQH